jgi:hypothetical protein
MDSARTELASGLIRGFVRAAKELRKIGLVASSGRTTTEEDIMRGLLVALALAGVVAVAASAAEPPIRHFDQQGTLGFFRGQQVEYLDLGPVKLASGNKVAPIWAFSNGAPGQLNVIDTVPGRRDYTPLWAVNMVTWRDAGAARVLRSAAAVRRALAAGDVTIARPGIVVNCPVL